MGPATDDPPREFLRKAIAEPLRRGFARADEANPNRDMALRSALSYASYLGLGTAGVTMIANSVLYDVGPGHKAVIFDKMRNGCQDDTPGPGTHLRIPMVQDPHIIDCRCRPQVIESQTGTKDVQQVQIVLRVLSRPDESSLKRLFQQYGNRKNFDQKVLPSVGNEVLKSVVAQYNAEELLSKREQISRQIYAKLTERAADFNLLLDDVSITHLQFGKEYANAIELGRSRSGPSGRVRRAEVGQEKVASITRRGRGAGREDHLRRALQVGRGPHRGAAHRRGQGDRRDARALAQRHVPAEHVRRRRRHAARAQRGRAVGG